MFEGVAKKTKYMVYSAKYDRECRIGELVDAETVERLGTHFDFYGFEDQQAVDDARAGFAGLDIGDDVHVCFLVALSGSMKGRKVNEACYGVLASALAIEDMGGKVSVLGYTTGQKNRPLAAFNGDRGIRQPGRLSEALHVVAKEVGTPSTDAAGSVLAMGAQDINAENLDGEALVWATRRLTSGGPGRKLLVHVTDGFTANCEASERFAEDRQFMKNHLKAVVEEIDASDDLEFAQVVLTFEWLAEKQDTYRKPVLAETSAPDVVRAVAEAIAPSLAPQTRRVSAPAM